MAWVGSRHWGQFWVLPAQLRFPHPILVHAGQPSYDGAPGGHVAQAEPIGRTHASTTATGSWMRT